MVYSLAFSLPGTPVLFYGEEIGMSENLEIEGRLSVRSPMQWSDEPHGGFSTAPVSEALCRPLVEDKRYGPAAINVSRQRREEGSLLNWFERLIRRRRECPEIGFGSLEILDVGSASVLAHRCDWDGSTIVAAHELGGKAATVTLAGQAPDDADALVDLFSADVHPSRMEPSSSSSSPTASGGSASARRAGACRLSGTPRSRPRPAQAPASPGRRHAPRRGRAR